MAINSYQNNSFVSLIDPVSTGASTTGTGIDTIGYNGLGAFVLQHGTATGTTPELNVKLQHSTALGSGYTDVTNGAFTQATAYAGIEALEVDMNSVKRYVRAYAGIPDATSVFKFGVSAVLPNKGQ
jgi:hypothetical protein